MQDSKLIPAKLLISLLVPMLIVTLGGLLVYKTTDAFFFPSSSQASTESNGPAVIYYALTLVIALMFFLMRQKYKWFEVIAFCSLSLVYSLSLQRMTPAIFRPVYLYFTPLLVFFILIWLILKYIFLNKNIRSMRLLLFSLLSSTAFTFAFRLLYIMLKQPADGTFLQSRFINGLMLFIFMGFGLSLAEFIIIRLVKKPTGNHPFDATTSLESDLDDDGKAI